MAVIVERHHYWNHRIYGVELNDSLIDVTVTSTPSVVRKWVSTTLFLRRDVVLRRHLVAGLGVQWTPSNYNPDPPADTLQLCVGRRCLIFQLSHADRAPLILRNFLANPYHTFVGFWNHSDRMKLQSSDLDLGMYWDPLDLRKIAETDDGRSLDCAPVNEIVEECLGFRVNQSGAVSMSDWNEEFLSEEQVLYACVDAHCAFLIGTDCSAWRFNSLALVEWFETVKEEGFGGVLPEAVPF